jgi:hypothetical protein
MQEPPEFLKALHHARCLSCLEGWRRMHIETIQVAIDQYAEAALGNRAFLVNKPHGIGGGRRNGDVP